MQNTKGLMQVTGVYKDGSSFLTDRKCPFKAEIGPIVNGAQTVLIMLVVPPGTVDSVMAGLASGSDLIMDNVPAMVDQF